MDTLTHALVGAAISDAAFRDRLGPRATSFALLAAALPDLDLLLYFVNPDQSWMWHRGYTHAIPVFFLLAPLLGLIGHFLGRKKARYPKGGRWLSWTVLAFLCLLSHTLLDLVTSWGTMPLLPFSDARLSWDLVPILDIFLTSVAAGSFALNRLLRWERVDEFLNPLAYPIVHEYPGRRWAATWFSRIAMLLLAAYMGVAVAQNAQTIRLAEKELAAQGVTGVQEVRALPIMFTYLAWGIVARDGEGNFHRALFSSYAPRPLQFTKVAGPSADPEVSQALASPDGQRFAWFTQNLFTARREVDASGQPVVLLQDIRFPVLGPSSQRGAGINLWKTAEGDSFQSTRLHPSISWSDIKAEVFRLWRLTRYGETDW